MSDFYEDKGIDRLEGKDLDRYFEGKDANKRFLKYLVLLPLTVIGLLAAIFSYFKKESDRETWINEAENITYLYGALNNIIKNPEVFDLKRQLVFMKVSKPNDYNRIFSRFNIVSDGLRNSWGGAVIPDGKYPNELTLTYYNIPRGDGCVYLLTKQRNGNWRNVIFGDLVNAKVHELTYLRNNDIAELCKDSKVITFTN